MTTNLFLKSEWTTPKADGSPDGWVVSSKNGTGIAPLPEVEWKRPNVSVSAGTVGLWLNNGALWADVYQMVNLTAGAAYKIAVEVGPRLIYGPPPTDPISSEFAFMAAVPSWQDGSVIKNNMMNPVEMTFTAVATAPTVIGFTVRLRHALDTNTIYLKNPRLELVSAAPNDPGTGVPTDPAPDKYATLSARLINLSSVASLIAGDVEQLQNAIQNTQVELARLRSLP